MPNVLIAYDFYLQLFVALALLLLLVAAGLWFVPFLITEGYMVSVRLFQGQRKPPAPRLKTRELALYHSVTHRPLAGVQVLLLDTNGRVLAESATNRSGRVVVSAHLDGSVLRFCFPGYQIQTLPLPLPRAVLFLAPVVPVRTEWVAHTLHGLEVCHIIALCLGTVALLLVSLLQLSFGVFILAVGYLGFWVVLLGKMNRAYQLAQIVHSVTGQPLAHIPVGFHRDSRTHYTVSNAHGFIRLPYPLPNTISYYKPGFAHRQEQALPAAAVGSELIILPLEPTRS